jgi:hypothetical protein
VEIKYGWAMTLKEQIIWTILGIDDADTLRQLLELAQQFRHREEGMLLPKQDPTAFLPSFSGIRVVTAAEALSLDYRYPEHPKEDIVGQWPGDEPVEELLQMIRP